MHILHGHDLSGFLEKRHLETPESKMSTPLKDCGHFRASQSLVARRVLLFRTFWSLLGLAVAFWGLLEALWGLLGAASCLLEPSGTPQLGLNAKEHTHDGKGSECHFLPRGVHCVVIVLMWRSAGGSVSITHERTRQLA
jgi:hypothetical protein